MSDREGMDAYQCSEKASCWMQKMVVAAAAVVAVVT